MSDDEAPVVILERFSVLTTPSYSVAGYTWCMSCSHKVLLGTQTINAVSDGAQPLCLECANRIHEEHPGTFQNSKIDHYDDAEVCPDCGKQHKPVDPHVIDSILN